MNLVYGNYSHEVGDAEVMISREGLVSELGNMYAVRERWEIHGRLHAADVAAVNAAVQALMIAYSYQGLDIYLNGSANYMRSSETINGTRVVTPPSFPQGSGGENTTYRNYSLAVEAEYPYVGRSVLLSWSESLAFQGCGSPVWGFLECLNGPPQQQMFQQQSIFHCTQQGTATCVPDSTHRNEWAGYWMPPGPVWPQWEHMDKRSITYELPSDLYGRRTTSWSYVFESNVPLGDFPNHTGIVMHLG
jgi:hypothetical protein